MPRPNLSGAYGVATPPPAGAISRHPERALRYSHYLQLVWAVRLGAIAVLLLFLYATHVI